MKRRMLISLGFVLIVGTGLILLILSSNHTETANHHNIDQSEISNDNETHKEDDEDQDESENEAEDDESANTVKNIIAEVVQRTLNIFSNKDLTILHICVSYTIG